MKPIKITSFEQINALYAKDVNICKGCKYEHAASCTSERFAICTEQANRHTATILAVMEEFEQEYRAQANRITNTQQPTQSDCGYIKNGVIYSSYDGRKIGKIK